MNTRPLLQLAFVIATGYFGSTACVARECTGDEAAEVGADGSEECKTYTLPEPHEGDTVTETFEYSAGTGLRIVGDFRNLEIEQGPAGEVTVEYKPRVDLAEGRSQGQIDATLEELDVSVSETGGDIVVEADRSGDSNVAALIEVKIPDDFDGDIFIDQGASKNDGGEVQLASVGSTHNIAINLPSLGETMTLATPNTVRVAEINVDSSWDVVTGDFTSPELEAVTITSERGSIETGFSNVPSGGAVRVVSEDGDITISLPGEGDYTMQAASGDVTFGTDLPSSCAENSNDGGASMTCGAGSEDMRFDFQMETEGAITIDRFLAPTE